MKKLVLAFVLLLLAIYGTAQTLPYTVKNFSGGNLNIRTSACTTAAIAATLPNNAKLIGSTIVPLSCGYDWYRVDIPLVSLPATSYYAAKANNLLYPDAVTPFVEVYNTGNAGLYVRTSPGIGNVLIGGLNAKIWDLQRMATTGLTSFYNNYVWYEIYLPSNCNYPTGWVSGQYLNYYPGQASCSYVISPTSNSVPAVLSYGTISITTQVGCSWTATSNDSWIIITNGSSGTGNGTVSYQVSANQSLNQRTGTIIAAGQTFTITQAGLNCSYSITPTNTSVGPSGASGSVNVITQAGCSWIATSNVGWAHIIGASSGTGNGLINYSIDQNQSAVPRTGTITVAGQTFTINQGSCSYTIAPISTSVGSLGASGTINVTSQIGCNWNATSNVGWVNIIGANSGTGNGLINYSIDQNQSAVPRTGTITVAGQTFTINQDNTSCSYTIAPTNASTGSNGGPNSITVNTQSVCAWIASANNNWISITNGSSGTGNSTVGYLVQQNSATTSRTGTITAAGQNFTITQAGVGQTQYTIAAASNPANSGVILGTGTYVSGSQVNLIAQANTGWRFVEWKENNITISTSANLPAFVANNSRSLIANFTVQANSPDLLLYSPLAVPSNIPSANITDVSYTVKNSSNSNAGSSLTTFFLSQNDTYDPYGVDLWLAEDRLPALNSNQSLQRTIPIQIPPGTAPGSWNIIVILDAEKSVTEFNEDNNSFALPINITNELCPDIDAPFSCQNSSNHLYKGLHCGQNSCLMALNYFGKPAITLTIDQVLDAVQEDEPDQASRAWQIRDGFNQLAEQNNIPYKALAKQITEAALREKLCAGFPVIIWVTWNMVPGNIGHAMLAVGIDDTYIYVNDPWYPMGKNKAYSLNAFRATWQNGSVDCFESLDGNGAGNGSYAISDELMIYPNPTSGLIHLYIDDYTTENSSVKILNSLGECVLSGQVSNNYFSADLSDKANGVYFACWIMSDGTKKVKRFVVQR